MIPAAALPRVKRAEAQDAGAVTDKWPVWSRLVIIVGLSSLLWAGIISAAVGVFG